MLQMFSQWFAANPTIGAMYALILVSIVVQGLCGGSDDCDFGFGDGDGGGD